MAVVKVTKQLMSFLVGSYQNVEEEMTYVSECVREEYERGRDN